MKNQSFSVVLWTEETCGDRQVVRSLVEAELNCEITRECIVLRE